MSEKIDATSTSTDASIGGTAGTTGSGGPKAIIKNVDMSEDMQQESVDIASAALEKYNIEKDIAAQIKKEFDKRHGPTWHVVVGRNFGSYVTHGTPFIMISSSIGSMEKPRILVVQKRSISSTFISALSPFSSGSHDLTDKASGWMGMRYERSGNTMGMIVSRRDTCTVTRATGRLDALDTPYRNCIRLIDCLTSPFPCLDF